MILLLTKYSDTGRNAHLDLFGLKAVDGIWEHKEIGSTQIDPESTNDVQENSHLYEGDDRALSHLKKVWRDDTNSPT